MCTEEGRLWERARAGALLRRTKKFRKNFEKKIAWSNVSAHCARTALYGVRDPARCVYFEVVESVVRRAGFFAGADERVRAKSGFFHPALALSLSALSLSALVRLPAIAACFPLQNTSSFFLFSFMCAPACFVHVQKSSNFHDSERLAYSRAARCAQCRQEIDGVNVKRPTAAHVVAYPCFNPCFGILTFKTTCSKCNNWRNAEAYPFMCGIYSCVKQPPLGCVVQPCFVPYSFSLQQPPATGASKDDYERLEVRDREWYN